MKVAVADASLSQPDREIVNAHFEEVMSVSDLADKAFIATGNAATTSASIKFAWQCEGRGLLSSDDLCEVLAEVCGELDWHALLQCVAPSLGADVDYGEFLAAPSVRWFHLGIAHMVTVARASAQAGVKNKCTSRRFLGITQDAEAEAELKLSGLAALFDSPNGTVTHDLASEALGRLLPSLRERQRHQLAKQALHRIGDLIRQRHGPPPLHSALIRFFKAAAHRQSDLLGPKEFVEGLQHLGTYECRDPDVPLLHAGRLYQLFEADSAHEGARADHEAVGFV
eukprot:s407_g2.t1